MQQRAAIKPVKIFFSALGPTIAMVSKIINKTMDGVTGCKLQVATKY